MRLFGRENHQGVGDGGKIQWKRTNRGREMRLYDEFVDGENQWRGERVRGNDRELEAATSFEEK